MLPAQDVVREFGDIRLAFGESDEYSFVLHKDTQLYGKQEELEQLPPAVYYSTGLHHHRPRPKRPPRIQASLHSGLCVHW